MMRGDVLARAYPYGKSHCGEIITVIALGAVCLYASLVLRDFFHHCDTYPYVATDDCLANVSYGLAAEGRYGCSCAPLQATSRPGFFSERHTAFFNYGPWYFYLGSALIWIFGYSLTLMRALHPVLLLVLIGLAFKVFRGRDGKAAVGLLAVFLIHCFQYGQWPMVRPDIMVSAFVGCVLLFASYAIRARQPIHWLLVGVFAGCAALTHLIAAAVVPVTFAILLLAMFREDDRLTRSWAQRTLFSTAAFASGCVISVVMFFASFGFRVLDFWEFIASYRSFLGDAKLSFAQSVSTHWQYAFNYAPPAEMLLVYMLIGLATLVTAIIVVFRPKRLQPYFACLVPPVALFWGYLLGLGRYPNFHGGYAILIQVLAGWVMCGTVFLVLQELGKLRYHAIDVLGNLAPLVPLALAVNLSLTTMQTTSAGENAAQHWVPFPLYQNEINDQMPLGASTFGSAILGMESPRRLNLVDFRAGARMANDLPEATRLQFAPDYILWGPSEQRNCFVQHPGIDPLAQQHVFFQHLPALFPGHDYELVGLVSGEPYGATRLYSRCRVGCRKGTFPAVSLYDPVTARWLRTVQRQGSADLQKVEPALFSIARGGSVAERAASATVRMSASPGRYLLAVRINPRGAADLVQSAGVCAHRSHHVIDSVREHGYSFDWTPYSAADSLVYLLVAHEGGDLYISQFGPSEYAEIRAAELYAIAGHDASPQISTQSLPALARWKAHHGAGIEVIHSAEHADIQGNDVAWACQLRSPKIKVPVGTTLRIRLPISVAQGNVGVGIMDGKEKWIVAPTRLQHEYVCRAPSTGTIGVFIVNVDGKLPSKFTVREGTLEIDGCPHYVDHLIQEWSRTKPQ